ncbi:MAG: SEC-C metal-binding domain-containing protein [Egibacteraceae bacterium]
MIGPPEEPCLCGSGRAHGHCCAHRNGHPLHERAVAVPQGRSLPPAAGHGAGRPRDRRGPYPGG